jgi:hypothetical protein
MLDEMFDFFKEFQKVRNDAVFLFVSGHTKELIQEKAVSKGIAKESVEVTRAEYNRVPTHLSLSDASIFYYAFFSKLVSFPVKQGELLMSMGISIVCNSGVLVDEFSEKGYEDGIVFLQNLNIFNDEKTIQGAQEYFSLSKGIARYGEIYKRLLSE